MRLSLIRIAAAALAGLLALLWSARSAGAETTGTPAEAPQPLTHPRPWSFIPIGNPSPPVPHRCDWVANPIDAFILEKLEQNGLSPAPAADKRVLLRRACFDLLGLPPSPRQIEEFLKDDSPGAYERLIDRLLASPAYGERWARHWLDVVRYADTGGFENDYLYPHAWQYRDYVIRALNANKPFDRFIQEQIAGDELWPDDKDAVTATALYCVGPALEESAMMGQQLEYEWMTDCADTTGAAFLGLTMGCARCHDHKYDPITQKDYYSLHAVFAASDRPYPEKVRLHRIKGLNGLLSDAPVPEKFLGDPRCTIQTEDKVGFHLFHREQPLEINRLNRGELNKPREPVIPAVPAALAAKDVTPDFGDVSPNRRRASLARWITSRHNPLTARVLVNRVWAWHFGEGIVRTPNDFGNQGELPTHPKLLDWLARDFVDHGWDLKRLHRLIMLSSTYRMQSIGKGRGLQGDPQARLLWHFPRQRLDGEAIRDAMLSCAGTLNRKPFGPPVVPPLGGQELAGLFNADTKWPITRDYSQHTCRSIYVLVRRTFMYPIFAAFDAPEAMNSCPRRFQTIVPTQALALFNSPIAREQSEAFARRLLNDYGDDDNQIVCRAWLLAFGRPISNAEIKHALKFLHDRAEVLGSDDQLDPPAAERGVLTPHEAAVAELCLALFNANEFVFVD